MSAWSESSQRTKAGSSGPEKDPIQTMRTFSLRVAKTLLSKHLNYQHVQFVFRYIDRARTGPPSHGELTQIADFDAKKE